MICLAVETTGKFLGLGLYSFLKTGPIKVLASHYKEAMSQQTEQLIPTLEKLLKKARMKRDAITMIAVDVGPGSFTGVRVGLAAARMMAQAMELPLVGVSSLEAMARPITQAGSSQMVVPVLPAVSNEVYFAAYIGPKVIAEPAWKAEEDLLKFLAKHKNAVRVTELPHPDAIADVAIGRFRKSARMKFPYEKALPMYLLPSWAERSRRSA